jgi:hypothetical protein
LLTIGVAARADDEPSGQRVRVHLDAHTPSAQLERYRTTTTVDVPVATTTGTYMSSTEVDIYDPVCTAPCDVLVETTGTYRVGGPSSIPTDGFRLVPGRENVIKASLGSRLQRGAGKMLTYVGVPVTLLGGIFWSVGAHSEDSVACAGCVNFHQTFVRWGAVLTTAGVVFLASGITLWATSGSSASIDGYSVALNHSGSLQLDAGGLHF